MNATVQLSAFYRIPREASVVMEVLIENVKEYPILYNSQHEDYKNIKKKDKVWEEIGDKLGEDGSILKIKWRNMRDSYTKHLKTFTVCPTGQSSQTKNRYRSWQWAEQMEFCKPFLKIAATEPNLLLNEFIDKKDDHLKTQRMRVKEGGEAKSLHGGKVAKKIRVRSPRSINYMQTKEKAADDSVDLLFQGLAKTVKTFSPKRRAMIKLKIANIVLQEEVEQREEEVKQREEEIKQRQEEVKQRDEESFFQTQVAVHRLHKTEPEPIRESRTDISLHTSQQPGSSQAIPDPLNTPLFDI